MNEYLAELVQYVAYGIRLPQATVSRLVRLEEFSSQSQVVPTSRRVYEGIAVDTFPLPRKELLPNIIQVAFCGAIKSQEEMLIRREGW
jgi:hypothetical protein